MKVTLDLDLLLKEGKITQEEYKKFSEFSAKNTGSLALNILTGFGVVAVSGGSLALIPSPATAIFLGFCIFLFGIFQLRQQSIQWNIFNNICILLGSIMTAGGILTQYRGAMLPVTIIFAVGSIFARSNLLSALSVLALSSVLGSATAYSHASYFVIVNNPTVTIITFTILAIAFFNLSKKVSFEYEGISIIASRTSVFVVNLGFWVGSLWGDQIIESKEIFSILWILALIISGFWAWKENRRWVINTVAIFAGIHFYTQWFETLGASAFSILIAGLLLLGFTFSLRSLNSRMKEHQKN